MVPEDSLVERVAVAFHSRSNAFYVSEGIEEAELWENLTEIERIAIREGVSAVLELVESPEPEVVPPGR